ncbi:MAG TPA: thioredoxin [Candidatus Acidoferrum sp.]|nr:thioredoxin [Candidatus Acidoferrum sp.]
MSGIPSDERGLLLECPQCHQRNRLLYERLTQAFRCGKCQAELHAPAEPIEIGADADFFSLTSRAALPVLADFWAPWCGPCKMVAPELVKVAAEGSGRWLVAKVNTDRLQNLAQRFGISGIPTLILFAGGTEVARQSGAMPAAHIRQFIESAAVAR